MPDLLAHVLFAYAAVTVAGRWIDWITQPLVTLGMVGAMIPDLSKIYLVIDDDPIEAIIGRPIEWLALHTGGGIIISITIGVVLVTTQHQRQATIALTSGALSHVILDLFLRTASGVAPYAIFWPITPYRPPTPGIYLSTQSWPTVIAAVLAAIVWVLDRRSGVKKSQKKSEADYNS